MVAPSACFTAKVGLVFVLRLENAFSQRFDLKPIERAYVPLKNGIERSACFYMTVSGNFERLQYVIYNFEKDIQENENLFQKTGVPLYS